MGVAGVCFIILLFFNSVPINQVLAVEEPIDLFAVDDPKEPFRDGEVVIQPGAETSTPEINLRPAGFKEYMYDTGIWYGVQWGQGYIGLGTKALRYSIPPSLNGGIILLLSPFGMTGTRLLLIGSRTRFSVCCHTSSIGPAGTTDGHPLLDLLFKAYFLNMRLKGLL